MLKAPKFWEKQCFLPQAVRFFPESWERPFLTRFLGFLRESASIARLFPYFRISAFFQILRIGFRNWKLVVQKCNKNENFFSASCLLQKCHKKRFKIILLSNISGKFLGANFEKSLKNWNKTLVYWKTQNFNTKVFRKWKFFLGIMFISKMP